jgi:hypothetical protein
MSFNNSFLFPRTRVALFSCLVESDRMCLRFQQGRGCGVVVSGRWGVAVICCGGGGGGGVGVFLLSGRQEKKRR